MGQCTHICNYSTCKCMFVCTYMFIHTASVHVCIHTAYGDMRTCMFTCVHTRLLIQYVYVHVLYIHTYYIGVWLEIH